MQKFDVIIIGAGPAGAMAAIEVAKQGLSVAVLEKLILPRRKVCAGGLVKRAVKLIPSEIKYPIEQQCHTITMKAKHLNMQFVETQKDLVTMVCRSSFDEALIKHASGLGVQVWDNTNVLHITPTQNNIILESNQGVFSSQYLIFAEGAMAKLSNQFWKDNRILLPSLEADVYASDKQLKAHQNAMFDFSVIRGGYAWVFPKGNHLSIGLAVMNKTCKTQLQQAFDGYLQTLGLTGAKVVNRKGFIIPLSPRSEPLARGRMLLVGDTAGLADPITAEGLTYAIQSGLGAGKAVSQAFEHPEEVVKIYLTQTIQPILNELRIARLLAKVIYHPNTMLRNIVFKHYGNRLCTGMADLISGTRDYASSLEKHPFLKKVIKKLPHKQQIDNV